MATDPSTSLVAEFFAAARDSPLQISTVTVVGSGASSSIPKMSCVLSKKDCVACLDALRRPNGPNHRLNPSLLIRGELASKDGTKTVNVLIDCCKTFRESALKVLAPMGVSTLDAVVLTHDHADATLGLDDLREFCSNHEAEEGRSTLSVWCDTRTADSMKRVFPYLFNVTKAQSYVALLEWQIFGGDSLIFPGGIPLLPLAVEHGKGYISYGYAAMTTEGPLVYLSDVSEIPPATLSKIKALGDLSVLIVDMLGFRQTPVHFNYDEAVACTKQLNAKRTFFVGMGHMVEHSEVSTKLSAEFPDQQVALAYDGLVVMASKGSQKL